jgi:hypothetical protein
MGGIRSRGEEQEQTKTRKRKAARTSERIEEQRSKIMAVQRYAKAGTNKNKGAISAIDCLQDGGNGWIDHSPTRLPIRRALEAFVDFGDLQPVVHHDFMRPQ